MNAQPKLHKAEFDAKNIPKPKTLDLRLAVASRDLPTEIKRAFDLAKSAGRELNATFTFGAS